MSLRPLRTFFASADELLAADERTLGEALLLHLKSYEGLSTVHQHGEFNREYLRAMLDNRNIGLGPLPKEPEYGLRQPEVTRAVMEAWTWLELNGILGRNPQQPSGDWFLLSTKGEKLLGRIMSQPGAARVQKTVFISYR